jgi:hypothetical protein
MPFVACCVNVGILLDDIMTVFLSYLVSLGDLAAFSEEIAVLLMANCSAYATDDVISLRSDARVRVITFAPHTTQVFQVVDVTISGLLEGRPRYDQPFGNDDATIK